MTFQLDTALAWYAAFDGTIGGVVDGATAPTDTQIQTLMDAKRNVAWGT